MTTAPRFGVAMVALLLGCVSVESSPIPQTSEEEAILDVLDDMARDQGRGMRNVSQDDGRLLRLLTEVANAKHVVEIGTSNGYSAIWFCLALRSTGGKLTTYEIDPEKVELARPNFERAGVSEMVTIVVGDAHREVLRLDEPIDVLFLDADKQGYIDYLQKLLPRVRPGGLILAHNMAPLPPAQADPRYVDGVTSNPDLERIFLHKSYFGGVGVTLKKKPAE
jgi:predicted O-methyltransferase YrrM